MIDSRSIVRGRFGSVSLSLALGAVAVLCPLGAEAAKPAVRAVVKTHAPLKARVWFLPSDAVDTASAKWKFVDVAIVGRSRTELVFAPDATGKLPSRLGLHLVTGVDFEIEYDRYEVMRAMARNNWARVISLMNRAYAPFSPYLDLPNNNAIEGAMQLGTSMFKFARKSLRNARNDKEREQARLQFKAAYDVFDACSKAEWTSDGLVGAIKACRCLILAPIGKLESVERCVADMEIPVPGDEAYGHYWLLRSEIAWRRGRTLDAMDAAVKSLCFQNKDVETFPDSLLLSAGCYEVLGNYHRARDVYFEVAKLFPKTDWAEDAAGRLEKLMLSGSTRGEERRSTENVFFGLTEDMNKLADEYLKERAAEKPFTLDVEEEEKQEPVL